MSGVSIGQAISIIGGSPILKNVLGHTVDHLKIPRHIDVGNVPGMSSIMSGILSSGGLGSLLQSPLGSSLSQLTSTVSSAVSSLTSAASGGSGTDFTPLVTALGSLSASGTNLSALADNLVGFASAAGLPTQLDAIGHMNLLQSLGTALPAAMSLATVMAPTGSAGLLTSAQASVQSIVAQATAGTMAVTDAVTAMQAVQARLDAVTNASASAVASLQNLAPALAAGQAVVALLVAGSPEMIAAINTAIQPSMLPAVQAMVSAYKASFANAANTQAAAAAAASAVAEAIAADAAQAPAAS